MQAWVYLERFERLTPILRLISVLMSAIREGVTRNKTTNMGNGLYGSFRLANLSSGYFSINSGFAILKYNKARGLHITQEQIPYGGTAIVCGIETANPDILSEALSFRGKPYSPGFSVVDRMIDLEGAVIKLKDEVKSFGSRDAAKPVRIKIENIISACSNQLEIDLNDVALISSSFADEVWEAFFATRSYKFYAARTYIWRQQNCSATY